MIARVRIYFRLRRNMVMGRKTRAYCWRIATRLHRAGHYK